MTGEKAQKFRLLAATWRALLEDALAPRPLVLDPKKYTGLQHGAQVKENVVLVLSQLRGSMKGDRLNPIVLPLSGLLTDSASASTVDANALSYHLADNLGQVADCVERVGPSATISVEVEQLVNALLEDTQTRASVVEQSYAAYRQQQAQQQ